MALSVFLILRHSSLHPDLMSLLGRMTEQMELKPATGLRLVHAQLDVDLPKFQRMFVDLMKR